METARLREFDKYEEEFLVDGLEEELREKGDDLESGDLHKFAIIVSAADRKIAMAEQHMNEQVERIKAICGRNIDKMKETKAWATQQAEHMMAGEKKKTFAGFGSFRFRKLPAKVSTDGYDGMADEERETLHHDFPDFFNTVVTVKPKKREIKAALTDGAEVRGFSISEGGKVFEFVAE